MWYLIFYNLVLLFFFCLLVKCLWTPNTHKNQLPSPSKLPIIGNLHQLGSLPHRSLYSLSQKYGPLMLLHFGTKPTLIVSSAEAAREIMKTHDLVFSNRPKLIITSKLTYNTNNIAFAPMGEYWRQMRSICVHQLLGNKRVQSFRSVREEETMLMIEKIRQSCSHSPSIVNLSENIILLTNNVLCRVALGRKYSSGEQKGRRINNLIREFLELLGVFDVGDYVPWLRWVNNLSGLYKKVDRVAKDMDEFFDSVVEEHLGREKEGSRQDFVDVLLEFQRENIGGFSIGRENIKALILDMFVAGTDTTYTSLEWIIAELLRNPKVLKELQQEVRGITKGKYNIIEDDLEKMHYLRAVIKESMRLHPPLPLLMPRESTKDVKLMGYNIDAKTQVLVNASAIGRDPLTWDKAEEFRPERFLDSRVDFRGHNFELIPFSAGRRGCPGIEFAASVVELALANLMRSFNFDLPDGIGPEDLDMSETAGMTVHKRVPILAIVSLASPHFLTQDL